MCGMAKGRALGAWVPGKILRDQSLSLGEKVILTVLHALQENREYSFATNQTLAGFLGMSTRQVQTLIAGLKRKRHIKVTHGKANQRIIAVTEKWPAPPGAPNFGA